MRKIVIIGLIASIVAVLFVAYFVFNPKEKFLGAPSVSYQRTILPETDSAYDLGSLSQAWRKITTDEICLTGDSCETMWPTGGSGASTTLLADSNTWSGINTFNNDTFLANSTSSAHYTSLLGLGSQYFSGLLGTGLLNTSGNLTVTLSPFSTSDLSEGSNLYWTNNRFDTRFATKSTTDLAEGSNLYWTDDRFDSRFAATTTTGLNEGTNLYWTDTRFDNRLSATTSLPNITTLSGLTSIGGPLSLSGFLSTASSTVHSQFTVSGPLNASSTLLVGGRLLGKQGSNIASANDLTLGAGNFFLITGTTQINGIATTGWTAGSSVILKFAAALTVKHNTAASAGFASLSLAGASDYATSGTSTLSLVYDGTYWLETARSGE